MSEVFHQSDHESNHESDQSSIESSSEDDQEYEGETSSSDEEGNGEVREESVVRDVEVEVREEEDELPDVELDENNSIEVNKSNLEQTKKHVTVKPQEKVPKWNNERLYPPSSKCKSKAWQFGGFLKDSKTGQLLTQKTVCGFCGLKQNYRCFATNMDQHMAAAHSLRKVALAEKSQKSTFFSTKKSTSIKKVLF